MASLLIRQIDERTKSSLRRRAAEHNRSMEAEARAILKEGLRAPRPTGESLYARIRAIVEPMGGIELDIPPREPVREPPDFGQPAAKRRAARQR